LIGINAALVRRRHIFAAFVAALLGEVVMITLEDCFGMCGLDPAEIAAISEHEHLPEIEAAAFASYLLHRAGGAREIRKMLIDDVRNALHHGDVGHAVELLGAFRHFLEQHPEAREHVFPDAGATPANAL
jgi:hypothetical protein